MKLRTEILSEDKNHWRDKMAPFRYSNDTFCNFLINELITIKLGSHNPE